MDIKMSEVVRANRAYLILVLLVSVAVACISHPAAVAVVLVNVWVLLYRESVRKRSRLTLPLFLPLLLFLAWATSQMLFYTIAYGPVGLAASYRVTLRLSDMDLGRFELTEEYPVGVGRPITVEEVHSSLDQSTIEILDEQGLSVATPFRLDPGRLHTVIVRSHVISRGCGFLVDEVSVRPSELLYTYSEAPGSSGSTKSRLCAYRSGPLLEAELVDFPRDSLYGTNGGKAEIVPYGNTITAKWQAGDIGPVKLLYIPRPYYSLRWLLSPVLGLASYGAVVFVLLGVAVSFIAGLAAALFRDALKRGAQGVVGRVTRLLGAPRARRERRRKTLEELLPPGVSVDQYLDQERKRKRERHTNSS